MKRKKLPKLKSLRKKLWEITKTIVRARNELILGGWLCYTCDKSIKEPKKAHTGHLLARATGGLLLYYNLDTLKIQCFTCNRSRGGEGAIYLLKLIDELGIKKVRALLDLRHSTQKLTRAFLNSELEHKIATLHKLDL